MTGPRLSIIPARAATDPELKPRDLQVLCVLGRHTDDLGWCRKSQVKMAAEMGCARSTVFDAIERLVSAGYLERHVQEEESGRDSPHLYRVVLDPVHPRVAAVRDADDPCRYIGTPADISAPPAGPEPAPPAGPGPAPKNDPFRTTDSERREGEARARDDETADKPIDADTPGKAAFSKRVLRLCSGRGFAAGKWEDWDTVAPDWIARGFAALTSAERAEAERWRDAYLLDIRARGKAPVSLGNWLRGRMWTGLEPEILERFEKRKNEVLPPDERRQPDGWAVCLGNVGMVWLMAKMIAGPVLPEIAARPLLADGQLREAWPAVWWWQARHRQSGGAVFDPVWHGRKHLMEFVPHQTETMSGWREEFVKRGWRWLLAFDGGNGVWLPKGGPAGLAAFEAAIRDGAKDHDGGGREAAE